MNTQAQSAAAWTELLRCPYCNGQFTFAPAVTPLPLAEFGVLHCKCSRFPVIDGIPIVQRAEVGMFEHTTGATEVAGISTAALVALIESSKLETALLECLAVPASLPRWFERILPMRITHHRLVRHFLRALGKRRLRNEVLARRQDIDACELLDHFYRPGSSLNRAVGQYFVLRFGQPRHLAALALVAGLPAADKPVLDIACGTGHLEHYLTQRSTPTATVGIDMNYFHLWIARHWIAPAGRYVCCNANDGLPFADAQFSATLCSDAYHYITNRAALLQEIERCGANGPVLLTRVGNREVMPNEGTESSGAEYLRELHASDVRTFTESELLKAYLKRESALAAAPTNRETLNETKWLSFGWNLPRVAEPPWSDSEWPHAVGSVGINPIYVARLTEQGALKLRFEFPLVWYAYENHEMLRYHPRSATLRPEQIGNYAAWQGDPSLRALVESFVLIGLPQRFRRDAQT